MVVRCDFALYNLLHGPLADQVLFPNHGPVLAAQRVFRAALTCQSRKEGVRRPPSQVGACMMRPVLPRTARSLLVVQLGARIPALQPRMLKRAEPVAMAHADPSKQRW